jgi:hypothetical protein
VALSPPNGLIAAGAVFALLGLAGFAIPVFTTQQTQDVARIGELRIQTTQNTAHSISPYLSGGALALGVVLMGAALCRRT